MLLQGEKKMPHRSGFQPLSGMAIQIRIADQKLNSQPDIFIRDKSADGLRGVCSSSSLVTSLQ